VRIERGGIDQEGERGQTANRVTKKVPDSGVREGENTKASIMGRINRTKAEDWLNQETASSTS